MGPILIAVAVAGTAAFSSVKPPSLDTVEYSHVIQLTHLSTQAVKGCKEHNFAVDSLEQQAELIVEYETSDMVEKSLIDRFNSFNLFEKSSLVIKNPLFILV